MKTLRLSLFVSFISFCCMSVAVADCPEVSAISIANKYYVATEASGVQWKSSETTIESTVPQGVTLQGGIGRWASSTQIKDVMCNYYKDGKLLFTLEPTAPGLSFSLVNTGGQSAIQGNSPRWTCEGSSSCQFRRPPP